MAERAADRLARLLGLVPYLTRRPGTTLDELAAHFQVDAAQIVDDLELLFVTGRPGHLPDDLIEAEWEDGRVYVGNAEEVSVPVRLSPYEAAGLLLAVEHLAASGAAPAETVAAVREKLARTAGGAAGVLDVAPPTIAPDLAARIRSALREDRALRLEYYVPSRDELTVRTVTPHQLRLGRTWYLDAHCHTSGGERSFAVERIRSAVVTDRPAADPPDAAPAETGSTAGSRLRLVLAPEAAWLADELAASAPGCELVHDAAGPGTVAVTVPRAGRDWARRLLAAHGRGVLEVEPASLAREAAALVRAGLDLCADAPARH
ncbi:helix-turn-helix transcriptional regulator [Brevibacterium album]|uniref:helix-turn-helix transcriptional regulator n=1 Tax=Brevibacterium album TaxID=417948 RepID=UPI00041128D9|nr:WYL domain-containing protein [Brevibacterium album]